MPTYDYVCDHCGHRFEVIHSVHGEGPATCPNCGEGPVRKGFAPPAIHFKGSGWAKKDRGSARRSAAKAADGSGSGSTGEAGAAASTADGAAGSTPKTEGGSAASGSAAPKTDGSSSSSGSSAAD